MKYEDFTKSLLPIGARVKYRNSNVADEGCEGEGTIIAYFITAMEVLTNAKIISENFPYRIRFDISLDPNIAKDFPKGYEAVFGNNHIVAVDTVSNIFPSDDIRIMGRMWMRDLKRWCGWHVITDEIFAEMQKDQEVKNNWEFCIR